MAGLSFTKRKYKEIKKDIDKKCVFVRMLDKDTLYGHISQNGYKDFCDLVIDITHNDLIYSNIATRYTARYYAGYIKENIDEISYIYYDVYVNRLSKRYFKFHYFFYIYFKDNSPKLTFRLSMVKRYV